MQVLIKFEEGLCHTPLPPDPTLCTYDYAINILRCLNFLVPRSKIFLKYFPFFKRVKQNLSLTIWQINFLFEKNINVSQTGDNLFQFIHELFFSSSPSTTLLTSMFRQKFDRILTFTKIQCFTTILNKCIFTTMLLL